MIYYAKEPKFLWILLCIVSFIYAYALESSYSSIFYVLLFFSFTAMALNYRLEIKENTMFYEMRFLRVVLNKRTIHATEIKKIQFVYASTRTIVLIHVKNRMRLKIHRFVPNEYDENIKRFANNHSIPIETLGVKRGS
ncbi:hypothetical protein GN156_04570 [bacterium LRH843]|nr:hypothetical protein [bacterium LRH843]